jgi:hypothetical protein
MAGANLPAKKYKKTSPTVLRLSFEGTGNATRFIDIARALSIINRKFYRQGVYYYVNSIELYNNEDAFVDIHTLPDNWVTKNSWNKAFGKFQTMNSLVDTPRPAYHDFKVRMSNLHTEANTMDPELFGINSDFRSYAPDEWDYSRLTTQKSDGGDADMFTIHMLGPHVGAEGNWQSLGAIRGYQMSRGRPPTGGSPNVPFDNNLDPFNNMFDMSSDHALDDIQTALEQDNDETPYDHDSYIGELENSMQHVARLATSVTTGRVAKASGFCAPMGLICVDPQNTATAYRVVINLAAGTYHGVYAERA